MKRKYVTAKICFALAFVGCLSVLSASGLSQAVQEAPAKSQRAAFSPGLAIGDSIPSIELKNQANETVVVQKLLTKAPVVLVVFRSADW